MAPLHVDLAWLLDVEDRLGGGPIVDDYSALAAAVERHRFDAARFGHLADPAWRAAALLHTVIRLRPLPRPAFTVRPAGGPYGTLPLPPSRNELYGCMVAMAYLAACPVAVAPPRGALVELALAVREYRADVHEAAARIRSWITG